MVAANPATHTNRPTPPFARETRLGFRSLRIDPRQCFAEDIAETNKTGLPQSWRFSFLLQILHRLSPQDLRPVRERDKSRLFGQVLVRAPMTR
jgi:hypothetical protein